jgi:hypothetical protein
LVLESRVSPLASFLRVRSAPVTAAPDESVTTPVRSPVTIDWAANGGVVNRIATVNTNFTASVNFNVFINLKAILNSPEKRKFGANS